MCDGVQGEGAGVDIRLDGEDEVRESCPCGVVITDGLFGGEGLVREVERGEEDVIRSRGRGRRRWRYGLGA